LLSKKANMLSVYEELGKNKICQKITNGDSKVRCILQVTVYELRALRQYSVVCNCTKIWVGRRGPWGCLTCLRMSAATSTGPVPQKKVMEIPPCGDVF